MLYPRAGRVSLLYKRKKNKNGGNEQSSTENYLMAQIDIPKPCCQLHHTLRRVCLHGIWQVNWQLHMYGEMLTNFAPPRHPVPLWGARSPKSRTEIFCPHTHTHWEILEQSEEMDWRSDREARKEKKASRPILGGVTQSLQQRLSPHMMSFFMHDWVLTTFGNDWERNDCTPLFTVMWIQ